MKKFSLIFCSSLLFLACNSNTNKETTEAASGNQVEMKAGEAGPAEKPNAKIDPVCNMTESDMAYTDFSLNGSDTIWFCSPHCKEQFDKDPAKYAKK